MKTKIHKILRSTITSLLFLLLASVIVTQFVFASIKYDNQNLATLIDKDVILKECLDENVDEEIATIATSYLEDYLNYIFHKRSYPSLQTIDYSMLSEEKISEAKTTISKLSENINLEYEDVINLREANNIMGNGAILLLIDVGVLVAFLISCIILFDFKKGTVLFASALFLTSLVLLKMSKFIATKLIKSVSTPLDIFIRSMLTDEFFDKMTHLAFSYLGVALFILLIMFLLTRPFKKHY